MKNNELITSTLKTVRILRRVEGMKPYRKKLLQIVKNFLKKR